MKGCATYVLVLVLLSPSAYVHAQNMPQASQVNGVPLNTPELAPGTVTVRLFRERIGNNVPNHEVTLDGQQGPRTATTDAEGRAEFSGLAPGQTVRVRAQVDGEALESQEFQIAAQGGTRIALIAGIAAAAEREAAEAAEAAKQPARPGVVALGEQSRVIIEFQDDDLTVFYILDIVNAARTPIDTGGPLVIEVPADARGTTLLEGSSRLGSIRDGKLIITGPFPPGSTSLQVAYQLPWYGTAIDIQQTWPVAMDDVFVAVEKIGALTLSSPQIAQQQEGQASGQAFIMGVGPRLNPGQPMTITLGGLPNSGTWMRDIGVGAVSVILLLGAWGAFTAGRARENHVISSASVRESLFAELVSLERRYARGKVDIAVYRDRRTELLLEIEQVTTEMERHAHVISAAAEREGAPV